MRAWPVSPRFAPAIATGAKLSVWPLPSLSIRTGWIVPTRLSSQRLRGLGGGVTEPGGAGLNQFARKLRHARGGRVGPRRKGEDVSGDDVAIFDQFQCVQCHFFSFGGKSGDEVGADRGVGSRGFDALDGANRVGAAVAALHPLEDHVVAGLQRQMEVRHQARFASDQFEQRVVDLDAVER